MVSRSLRGAVGRSNSLESSSDIRSVSELESELASRYTGTLHDAVVPVFLNESGNVDGP